MKVKSKNVGFTLSPTLSLTFTSCKRPAALPAGGYVTSFRHVQLFVLTASVWQFSDATTPLSCT